MQFRSIKRWDKRASGGKEGNLSSTQPQGKVNGGRYLQDCHPFHSSYSGSTLSAGLAQRCPSVPPVLLQTVVRLKQRLRVAVDPRMRDDLEVLNPYLLSITLIKRMMDRT
jgi:hypothetical protein